MDLNKKISFPKALSFILLSTLLITGSGYSVLKWMKKEPILNSLKEERYIEKIIQTGPHRDPLSTQTLAEILSLSIDKKTKLKEFDAKAAKEALLALPMIKQAKVELIQPNSVFIDYLMRSPIAMLYDYENIAVDEEGYLFPFAPFYSPKQLPEIYLGLEEREFNFFHKPMSRKDLILAIRVLKSLRKVALNRDFSVHRIDVSKAFEKSLGKREIIVQIKNKDSWLYQKKGSFYTYTLRLDPDHFAKNLGNYLNLHEELIAAQDLFGNKLKEDERVIDLRLEDTAYIEEIPRN